MVAGSRLPALIGTATRLSKRMTKQGDSIVSPEHLISEKEGGNAEGTAGVCSVRGGHDRTLDLRRVQQLPELAYRFLEALCNAEA